MSSTASHATTSRTFARRATGLAAALATAVMAASVLTGGVAAAAPNTAGLHAGLDVVISTGGTPVRGKYTHPDCGVCIL